MSFESRIRLISLFVLLLGVVFSIRLIHLQAYMGANYRALVETQYSNTTNLEPFNRGSVYLTLKDGQKITAAGIKTGNILAIDPSQIKDVEATYKALASIIELDKADFMSRATKQDDPYEELVKRIDTSVANKINALELSGVMTISDQWRYYPGGALAGQIIGFVGYKDNTYAGQYGIERQYEGSLRRDTKALYGNFFSDVFIGIKDQVFGSEQDREANIVLTIEPRVQAYIEPLLAKLAEDWDAEGAGALIIDPHTGKIVAMASVPSFDPNNYAKTESIGAFSNPFVEDVFEMGSIMKPITMSAGIDAGVITRETEYTDRGYIELDKKKISNYDGRGRGKVDMQIVMDQSLNTGSVFIMQQLGTTLYSDYLYRFGFHDKTGIDLPNESVNLMSNLDSGKEVEYATASFGQGIAVTPITIVRALSAVANGGHLIKPHVVKSVDYIVGYSEETKVVEQGRAISAVASEEVTRMLVSVVDNILAGGKVAMPHYSIAAKTGTAQIANPNGGGYYDDRYFHSFFGYFPAYDPKYLVFLYLDQPKNIRYASETLSIPFSNIAKYLINYYDIPPDR